jgi:hypothetical protein
MEEVFANTSKVVVDSKANNMMVLPIDKLLDTKVRTNNTMTQGVQSSVVCLHAPLPHQKMPLALAPAVAHLAY